MPSTKLLSTTIGAGRSALHVSFIFESKTKGSRKGTIYCTVSCEAWRNPAIKGSGRLRRSTGLSVEVRHILSSGKVSDKAAEADFVRSELEGIVSRLRTSFARLDRLNGHRERFLDQQTVEKQSILGQLLKETMEF